MILPMTLAGCGDNQPITYAGNVVPQAGACDPASHAVLIRRGHFVRFTPHEGVIILTGNVAPDGAVAARASTPGADHKSYTLTLSGHLDRASVTGSYVTARCSYALSLKRSE